MIGVLVFPDFQLLDAAGPISVFEIAARYCGVKPAIKVIAAEPGPVRSSSSVEMIAKKFGPPCAITTLMVAGGDGVEAAAKNRCTIRFVQVVAKRGIRVSSVCSGTFILAEAGLLDVRRATTHWQRTRQFLATYPDVKLEPDRIFVRDGNIWSSAGITAGVDLALAMVAEDYGDEIVQKTARQLVLYHRRSGGQSQFSSLLEFKGSTGRFGPLLTWAREHLDAPLCRGSRRARRHECAAFYPRLHRRDRRHAVESDRAAAHRGGAGARAVIQRSDRARRGSHRLSRSRADAPRLHPRLWPTAASAAACGEGGFVRAVAGRAFNARTGFAGRCNRLDGSLSRRWLAFVAAGPIVCLIEGTHERTHARFHHYRRRVRHRSCDRAPVGGVE
jgi:transcriptional regulator GlxA family with amidase domain